VKLVWRFIKRWWWTFLVGAAAIAGVLVLILIPRDQRPRAGGETPKRTFKDKAKEEVERVRLEGEVEKARITATADVHREEIDRIEEIGQTDPAEGRRQLAAWLASNL
jgi:hypothetical protein